MTECSRGDGDEIVAQCPAEILPNDLLGLARQCHAE